MSVDKERLRELALGATPGKWEAIVEAETEEEFYAVLFNRGPGELWFASADKCQGEAEVLQSQPFRDAAYIAAAAPETVLALLDELRQSEEARQELMNDFGEMQRRTERNADLYRRDLRYALDLIGDILKGDLTVIEARDMVDHVHEEGRKELEDWRLKQADIGLVIGEDEDA